jgi:hypothetical protein
MTAETTPLVNYLTAALQRIVNSANEELADIRRGGMADPIRQAEEARVVNSARAFAVRRVESTVRHLRDVAQELPTEYRPRHGLEERGRVRRFATVAPAQADMNASIVNSPQLSPESPEQIPQALSVDQGDRRLRSIEQATPPAKQQTLEPKRLVPDYPSGSDDADVLKEIAAFAEPRIHEVEGRPSTAPYEAPPVDEDVTEELPAGHEESPVGRGPDEFAQRRPTSGLR